MNPDGRKASAIPELAAGDGSRDAKRHRTEEPAESHAQHGGADGQVRQEGRRVELAHRTDRQLVESAPQHETPDLELREDQDGSRQRIVDVGAQIDRDAIESEDRPGCKRQREVEAVERIAADQHAQSDRQCETRRRPGLGSQSIE
jgi:hypothetical protein